MIPTLAPDDEVLVDTKAYGRNLPQVGEIVVAHRPDRPSVILIKRISAVQPDGQLLLTGDNPAESTDSSDFGSVSLENVIGKVTGRFA